MEGQSGLFKAGTILLLVGAILGAATALLVLMAAVWLAILNEISRTLSGPNFSDLFGPPLLYFVWALASAVGAVFGFLAYAKARRGDAHGAFVFGLAAALLPPVQVVLLLGAIFCKVSPEGEAARSLAPPQAP